MKSPKRRRPKSSIGTPASVKHEIEQLRDWANRGVELEFIIPLAGSPITFLGRIFETSSHGEIRAFHFTSRSGMQARLVPQMFPQSQVEKVENFSNTLCVQSKTTDEPAFVIREFLFEKKPNPKLARVLEKLRSWARSELDLHVFLNQGAYAISFLGHARELFSGMFSFVNPTATLQLIIRVEAYKCMEFKSEGDESHIMLIDSRTEQSCMISDIAMPPETLFKRFSELSSTIH
jgi:hypothetical protein